MNQTSNPSTAQPVTLARDIQALQRRVRAFAGTGRACHFFRVSHG
ncbi:MAG: hypothetical protein WCF33_10855 [Pseudonocardiaceae bacterium]